MVGHGPTGSLVEGNGSHVLDSGVQLDVRMAAGRDPGFASGEKSSAEALALVVWRDEQVDQSVAADGDVGDRVTVEDGYERVALGLGLEPVMKPSSGALKIGGVELAGKQLTSQLVEDLLRAGDLDTADDAKAEFALRSPGSSIRPTRRPPTGPTTPHPPTPKPG